MLQVSDESLEKFKQLFANEGMTYETEEQYRESANNLLNFVNVLVEIDMEERDRKARLEKNRKVMS